MKKLTLNTKSRDVLGRKIKKLRQQGILPGNVFGKKIKSEAVQVELADFEVVYKAAGETGLVTLVLEKDEKPVLIHNFQVHPVTGEALHVDFLQVDLKEKVEADVPVEVIGESPTEKQGLGTVVQYVNEITVEALPTDLPEKFEIDVTELVEVDQAIHVKDIKVDRSKIDIKTDAEQIIVKVEPPQKEEVVEAPVAAEGTEAPGEATAEGPTPEAGKTTEEPQK